jgi:hypothetical protein
MWLATLVWRMKRWKDGKLESWKDGEMEGWKDGSIEVRIESWKVGKLGIWVVMLACDAYQYLNGHKNAGL